MSSNEQLTRALTTLQSDSFRREVEATLPPGVPLARFVAVARTALIQNPQLAACDPRSLFAAVKRCAFDGLMPDGREAAFVAHFSQKLQRHEATYIPMIGGLRKIAAEHGVSIAAYPVYERDEFVYRLGSDPDVQHVPAKLGQPSGGFVGVYAVATDRDGRRHVEVMSRSKVDAVRARSRAADKGPWVTDYEEMARKTVARRLFKSIPLLMEKARSVVEAHDSEYDLDGDAVEVPMPRELVAADAAFDEPEPQEHEHDEAPQPAPSSATPVAATQPQARKLNVLVGKLRDSGALATEQLWAGMAKERGVEVETMVELLGGRDADGVLHWEPLRDSLTKAEASDLIERLTTLEAVGVTGP